MTHHCDIGSKALAGQIVKRLRFGLRCNFRAERGQGGNNALRLGLAQRHQSLTGGDHRADPSVQVHLNRHG